MGENEVVNILQTFKLRPKKLKGKEFTAEVTFQKNPSAALDKEADLFDLEIGNTLKVSGRFKEISLQASFYGSGQMAGWLEDIEQNRPYTLTLKCLFGVHQEVEYTGKGPLIRRSGKQGFLIQSVKEEGINYAFAEKKG